MIVLQTASFQALQKENFDKNPSPIKLMIILHVTNVCHPIPWDQTVNTKCYKSLLQYHLHHKFRDCPEQAESATILHNNATAHSAHTVKNVLWHCKLEVLQHPPYSPDLCVCDYNLTPKLKKPLHGKLYADKTRQWLFSMRWHGITRHLNTVAFSTFSIMGNELQTTLGRY
jgi:hypothetical protein